VKLRNVTLRALTALMLLLMLGLQVWSSQSMAHDGLAHAHAGAANAGEKDDATHSPESSDAGSQHRHSHNTGDHAHDVPLKPNSVQIRTDGKTEWRLRDCDSVCSAVVPPPERPPKQP